MKGKYLLADFSLQAGLMGYNAAALARKFQVEERTARRWLAGKAAPPLPIQSEIDNLFQDFLDAVAETTDTMDENGGVLKFTLDATSPGAAQRVALMRAIYLEFALTDLNCEICFKP